MSNLYNLIGIPFKDKGRDIKGCDCMGLAVMAHEEFGKNIPDFLVDSDNSEDINSKFLEQLYSNCWTELKKPEVPCIVVFGFNQHDPKMITHVGTYIGEDKVLHIVDGKNNLSHIIKMDHPFYKNKILGFYKYE